MDYYSKYIKYKTKYLELKKQLGGINKCHFCGCTNFVLCTGEHLDYDIKENNDEFEEAKKHHGSVWKTISGQSKKESHCLNCGLQKLCHDTKADTKAETKKKKKSKY